jgi:hypothetical protein
MTLLLQQLNPGLDLAPVPMSWESQLYVGLQASTLVFRERCAAMQG